MASDYYYLATSTSDNSFEEFSKLEDNVVTSIIKEVNLTKKNKPTIYKLINPSHRDLSSFQQSTSEIFNTQYEIYLKTTNKRAMDFIVSAFDDYTSARFLLIHNYALNGVILASIAIEKYLKAFLTLLNGDVNKVHFDKLDEIKDGFRNTQYEVIFKYPDPLFFEILSLGYRCRYYDNIKEKTTLSFAVNQLLGELDYFILLLETLTVTDINGNSVQTIYKKAQENNDIRIYEKNYILNKVDKTEFYQSETIMYGLHFDPPNQGPILIQGFKFSGYHGELATIVDLKIDTK